jgi:hypothetical protein
MNGKYYFLDTNAIIQLLKGNQELLDILQEADFIACPVISKLEYLSFPNISENDIELFNTFAEKIEIMDLPSDNNELHQQILYIRKDKKLKLPDAIIAGCCTYKKCTLITADKKILEISGLATLSYQPLVLVSSIKINKINQCVVIKTFFCLQLLEGNRSQKASAFYKSAIAKAIGLH